MKIYILLLLGAGWVFTNLHAHSFKTDLAAYRIIEKRTGKNGVYFQYEIMNMGNATVSAHSYEVYFKVNGKVVSFDRSTTEIKPGETITYETGKNFYAHDYPVLDYTLEIKFRDDNPENNVLKGRISMNK